MAAWVHLDACRHELNAAINVLARHSRKVEATSESGCSKETQLLLPPDAPLEAHRARRAILMKTSDMQSLVAEPVYFLQELARQVSLAALKTRETSFKSGLMVL